MVLEKGNEKTKRNSEVVIEHDTNIDANNIWPQIHLLNKFFFNFLMHSTWISRGFFVCFLFFKNEEEKKFFSVMTTERENFYLYYILQK